MGQGQLWWRPTGHCRGRGDTVKNWEPGSVGDSSQNQDEEVGAGHNMMQKRAEVPSGPTSFVISPLRMAWDTFLILILP